VRTSLSPSSLNQARAGRLHRTKLLFLTVLLCFALVPTERAGWCGARSARSWLGPTRFEL
jgi:hypothetical protein